jgi:hypothetical protein
MLTLGPFQVSPDGALAPRAPGLRPVVRYAWRGRACAAEVTEMGWRLVAVAGRIPSTARQGVDRRAVVTAVGAMRGNLPPGLRLHLLADHRVVLRAEDAMAERPVRAHALVAGMVRFALLLDGVLDELDALGAGLDQPVRMSTRAPAANRAA